MARQTPAGAPPSLLNEAIAGSLFQVEAPAPSAFRFEFPAALFSDRLVSAADLQDVRARLDRVFLYKGRTDRVQDEIFHTALTMMAEVAQVHEYFQRHYPQYEVLNVSLLGSYLWVQRPHDLDFNVIVRGNAVNHFHLDDATRMFPAERNPVRPGISDIDVMILGEDNLSDGEPCPPGQAVDVSDAREIVDTARADFYIRNFVLSGCDFNCLPHLGENSLAHVYTLLNTARERIQNTYFRRESDQTRFSKVLVRLINAEAYLKYLQPGEQDRHSQGMLRLLRRLENSGPEVDGELKLQTVEAYNICLEKYKAFLSAY